MANVNRADWVDSGIVLRGINSEGVGGPSGSPLATTYVDGVPQTQNGARRGVNGTWDLQQVEVWRGPQSTIVGRNALAGAIQVKTNDPTMTWETAARFGSALTHSTSGGDGVGPNRRGQARVPRRGGAAEPSRRCVVSAAILRSTEARAARR
jgi:outer membrane receptor protein involved in Fe transport